MNCIHFTHPLRRIARALLLLAAVSGFALAAESPSIRFSAPALAWILAADGSQAIEISGVVTSPRMGRAIDLPAVARRSWPAPNASAVLLRLDSGLFLLRSNGLLEPVMDLSADVEVTIAWDRASAGFAACWLETCQDRTVDAIIRRQWTVPSGARAMAFSVDAGLIAVTAAEAMWYAGADFVPLPSLPTIAAFRSGTNELWILDASGHLTGQNRQGSRLGQWELVPNGLGLVSSADGKLLFSANAEGAAAQISLETGAVERFFLEDTVEGVWAAPGPFAVRLHESAKRPIAIWSFDGGAIGWTPAIVDGGRQ